MGGAILLVIGVAVLCILPFLPVVRTVSNGVVDLIPGISTFADTPISPIIGLLPIFTIGIVIIAIAYSIVRS